jgi:DNA polymerase family A
MEALNPWVLDVECFFDDEFTLKKLTTEAYCRDPRFEFLLLGVITPQGEKFWVPGPQIGDWLQSIDWSKQSVLCHHAQFDLLALNHHFKMKPGVIYDSLSMARLSLGVHLSVGLDNLAKHFGLAGKVVPYNEFRGKRFSDLDRDLLGRLGAGCLHDCALTLDIFHRLRARFPADEYQTIDTTVRMFTEPVLDADIDLLGEIWLEEEARRVGLLATLGTTAKSIGSNDMFICLLEEQGVEIEYKEGKNGPIPAFAKTDHFMEELLEDDNPRVQALAAARLGIKSTIDQTRAERFGYMATRGRCPVYLRYCGAHTTRWSGGDGVNWQNLRRGGKLRKAIKAPPGCVLVVVDSSQIECRILNEFAGQDDVIERFRTGADPYIGIASQAYGRPITKEDKAERGTGKQLELSCGYGAGAATIQKTARLGVYGPPVQIDINTAERWKHIYRDTHLRVVQLWKEAELALARMLNFVDFDWGPLQVRCEETGTELRPGYELAIGRRRISLPGCAELIYDSLEWYNPTADDPSWLEPGWRVKTRRGFPTKMYGAKLVENVVQYMARMVVSQAANRIVKYNIKIATTCHDELVGVVPLDMGQQAYEIMSTEMCRAPEWMPDLPLGAEGGVSERYEK